MKRSHTSVIAVTAALIFSAALGSSLLFRAQLSVPGSVCFTLGFSNNFRITTNNLSLPVGVKVMAGTTQVYNQTVTSDSMGKVTATLPASASTSHTVTVTPVGHVPVVFRVDGDLSGTCIAVPAPARAGDVNSDGTITTADLIGLIQAMRGIPSTTVSQTYGVPTIKLTQVVEAIRHMRIAAPGNLTVARGAASSSSSSTSSAASSVITVAGELGPYPSIQLPSYGGHPVIPNLTSITPKIVVSRTSGMTPFVVQVHGAETLVTFSDGGSAFKAAVGRDFDPYLDLEYKWDFGDAAGSETMQHPVTGQTVNANRDQVGPEAAYVYRNPGNYTVRLTVRGFNGSTYVTANTTTVNLTEIQELRLYNAAGGTFTVSANGGTTAPIAHNALGSDLAAALQTLPGFSGNVRETKYGLSVDFVHSLLGTNVPEMTIDGSGLTGTTPSAHIRTTQDGTSTSQITAVAWSGTDRYFDANYDGSNGASDGTINRPYKTSSDIHTWLAGGQYRRAFLKRGSTFGGISLQPLSHTRIEAYGTGEDPIVTNTTGPGVIRMFSAYNRDTEDVVFTGLSVQRAGSLESGLSANILWPSNGILPNSWSGRVKDIAFLDTTFSGQSAVQLQTASIAGGLYWTFWRNTFIEPETTYLRSHGLLIGLGRGLAIVGGSFSGGNGNLILDHHIYPTISDHSLFRWIDFRKAIARNFAINTNCRDDTVNAEHVLIVENDVTGTQNGLDSGNSNGGPGKFNRFIVQGNAIHIGQAGNQGLGINLLRLVNTTLRDNDFWQNPQSDYAGVASHFSVYRNRQFRNIIKPVGIQVEIYPDTSTYFARNIISNAVTIQWAYIMAGFAQQMRDWHFEQNVYHSPFIARPFMNKDTTTARTFAEWQALGVDPSAQSSEPNWKDPANGDFSPR